MRQFSLLKDLVFLGLSAQRSIAPFSEKKRKGPLGKIRVVSFARLLLVRIHEEGNAYYLL